MQKELQQLQQKVVEQAARIEELLEENTSLRRQVNHLSGQLFGRKSERFDPVQLELLHDLPQPILIEKPVSSVTTAPRKSPRPRVIRLPADLPTEEVIIDPEEVLQDPDSYKCVGQEVTPEYDVVPPKYFRRLIIRRKFVSKLDRECAPIVAELMPRLIPGSFASVGLVTDIVLKKYIEHLPLHRQEQLLKMQSGIVLSRKTMCDWVGKVADWLQPIYRHIRDDLRKSGYLQVDETPIRYCRKKGGGSGQGYLWVYHSPGGDVLFEWHASRAASCLEGMLDAFKGKLQCDAYAAYASFIKTRASIELHACWAHARRKVFDAKAECPVQAEWLLHQIGLLYGVERELKGKGPALRQAVREARSLPVLRRIEKMMRLKLPQHRPTSAMGSAISYALSLWPLLVKYVYDGRVEIDNNLVENAIRPTAIGKKNWMFIGHPDAGQRSAILYTILENCKRQGINPREYLLDVLGRLPSLKSHQTFDLTPARWAAARQKKAA
jgi:transposase